MSRYLSIAVSICLVIVGLTSCEKEFQKKTEPIVGNWHLRYITFQYRQESPSTHYSTHIFPPDSNRLTFSVGRYYEAKTNPSYDFMYFVRFGSTFRENRSVRQGVWEYYGEAYSPNNDFNNGKLVFDRGNAFYANQAEIFLDYDFKQDTLLLFSNTPNYAGLSVIYRFLGEQEARRKPENTFNYGLSIGSKWAFAEGFTRAADSLRWRVQNSSYLAVLRDYFRYFQQGAYLSDYEDTYPTFTAFLQGVREGRKGKFREGYNFALNLKPDEKPQYEISYYFSR